MINFSLFAPLLAVTQNLGLPLINGAGLRHKNATLLAAALHQPITRLFEVPKQESCLSGNTLQHYHRFISSVLSTAVQWQVIFANPCERVAPPKRKRKEAQYLTLEQVAHLLELLQNEPEDMRCMITLLLYTGLRRSELLGLEWKDIDFQAGLLSIRRTSQYVAGKGVFTDETKTYHSRRVLKLTDTALTLLRQHHAVQMQNRLRLGDCWQEHDRIFTRWDGAPMNPNSLTHRFHTFIHQTDLPPVTIHSIRHTNATLLIAEGAGVKAVSSHLGYLPSVSPAICMLIPCNRSKLQPQKRSKTRSRRPYAADVSASNKHQINTKLRKHTKCSFLFSPKKLQKPPYSEEYGGFVWCR